jgi:glycosyltransferase involved in cell wall biosynthesis
MLQISRRPRDRKELHFINGVAYVKYGPFAASTRARFVQYERYLREEGIEVKFAPLLGDSYLQAIFGERDWSYTALAEAYLSRVSSVRRERRAFSWVQYELFPYLPGFAERAVFAGGAPVVYDFDDAIFHQYDRHKNPLVRMMLGRKLQPLLRGARLAICGNTYLGEYAARFCRRVEIVPTVVDTAAYRPAEMRNPSSPITLGWIGSPSTWNYVRPMVPLLEALRREMGLRVRIVGAGTQADLPSEWEALPWSEEAEVGLIQGMDIGIMPLPDEPWARGKCGYKLIQYMACGLPAVASPVGVNAQIVEDGRNGFHALREADWSDAIRRLVGDTALRRAMGANGRKHVAQNYSLAVHGPRLARIIREVIEQARAPASTKPATRCAG